MTSRLLRWLAGLSLLAVTACTGSGLVLGGSANCTSSIELITQVSGACTRTLETLEAEDGESIAIQTSDPAPFATVEFELSVEAGQAAIIFTDVHGDKITTEATPGSPATGSVRVQLDPLSRINFKIAPVDGTAEGVEYKLSFVCDCMP